MSLPTAFEQNLLFAVLAWKLDFISRDSLIQGLRSWLPEKSKPLPERFLADGLLGQEELLLLKALVETHLEKHNNDARQSLAALSSIEPIREELKQLNDEDLAASLPHLGASANDDPYATQPGDYQAGESSTPSQRRFRILRHHAQGGLGQVSVALDEELHREVALKEIQPQHADNPQSRERFLVEAEVTGGLEHPGIVPVYGLGTYADGRPYYAMRFIRGDSLQAALAKFHQAKCSEGKQDRSLELRRLLGRFLDVCNAIAYAHSRGILHRDLKPGNIMLGDYGETLVVDWGLAKVLHGPEEARDPPQGPLALWASGSGETREGSVIGTIPYMSPEQAAGNLNELGPQTDVYSLGATLYHILTGSPPFLQKDHEVLSRVQKGEFPRPRQLTPETPKPLEAVCLKAMALKSSERYASAKELAEEIERWLGDEPVRAFRESFAARLSRLARRHRTAVRIGTGALALIAVIAIIAAFLVDAERKVAEKLADENYQLAQQEQHARGQAEQLAKDKSELAEKEQKQREQAYDHLANQFLQQQLPDIEQEHFLTALPWVAAMVDAGEKGTARRQAIHKTRWEFVRRQAPRLVQIWPGTLEEFSPDGTHLLLKNLPAGGAQVWDYQRRAPVGDRIQPASGVGIAAFDPTGKFVLTVSPRLRDAVLYNDRQEIQIWNAETGEPVTGPFSQVARLLRHEFRQDGQMLMTIGIDRPGQGRIREIEGQAYLNLWNDRRGTLHFWNPKTGEELTSPVGLKFLAHDAVFSPDSKFVAVLETYYRVEEPGNPAASKSTLIGEVSVWEIASGKRVLEPIPAHPTGRIAFSPDGSVLAIVGTNPTNVQVWDWKSRREIGSPLPIVLIYGEEEQFRFTKDSRRILVGGRLWPVRDLKERQLTVPPNERFPETIHVLSPDDRRGVGFGKGRKGLDYARVLDIGTHPKPVHTVVHHPGIDGALFSPDSRYVLTVGSGRTMQWDLAQQLLPAVELRQESASFHWGDFSPDGKRIATVSTRYLEGKPRSSLHIWDAATGKPLVGPVSLPYECKLVRFSPDGRRVLTTGGGSSQGLADQHSAQLWDASTGQPHGPLLQHDGWVYWADFNPEGTQVVTASADNTARLWDVETGLPLTAPLEHLPGPNAKSGVYHAQFSPDGRFLATASGEYTGQHGELRIWDTKTGKPAYWQSIVLDARANQLTFDPEGQKLAVATGKWARLFETNSGKELLTPIQHDSPVQQVAFDPTGQKLLSRSKQIHLWVSATGEAMTKNIPQAEGVNHAEFSPDGRWLLICGNFRKTQGKIRGSRYQTWLMDAHTADPVVHLGNYSGTIYHSRFSPDSRRILITPMAPTAEVYGIPDVTLTASAIQNLSRLTTGYYVDQVGGLYPVGWNVEEYMKQWESLRAAYPQQFTPTHKETQNWSLQELMACHQSGHFREAVPFARQLHEKSPENMAYRALLAELLAGEGQWKEAAAMLAPIMESELLIKNQGSLNLAEGRINILLSLPELYTLCLVNQSDGEAFSQYRDWLWQQFGHTQQASTAKMLLEVSLLQKWPKPDPRCEAILDVVQASYRLYDPTLARFRRGEYEPLIEVLTKKHGKRPNDGSTHSKYPLTTPITEWFVLAMSLEHQGKHEAAQEWHDFTVKALGEVEEEFREHPRFVASSWRQKAKWDLLACESSELLKGSSGN